MSYEAPVHSDPHVSIGEVLTHLREEFPDITISKIRFLESQGLVDPERTPSGYRKFHAPDLDRLRWILLQQRDHFLPLRVIKSRLDAYGPTGAPPIEFAAESPVQGVVDPVTEAAPNEPTRRDVPSSLPTGPFAELVAAIEDDDTPLGPLQAPDSEPAAEGLTRSEILATTGLADSQLDALQSFGLVVPFMGSGERAIYDEEALAVAEIAAEFGRRGIEARHLKMYQHSSEREAALFAQVLLPYVRQRNPAGRARSHEEMEALARLGHRIRTAMLRRALRDLLIE
jgi:DNA-binding transcriptional MerR regulator